MNADANVERPLASSLRSVVCAFLVFDQSLRRRRPDQLTWALGMPWYGLAAGAEFQELRVAFTRFAIARRSGR